MIVELSLHSYLQFSNCCPATSGLLHMKAQSSFFLQIWQQHAPQERRLLLQEHSTPQSMAVHWSGFGGINGKLHASSSFAKDEMNRLKSNWIIMNFILFWQSSLNWSHYKMIFIFLPESKLSLSFRITSLLLDFALCHYKCSQRPSWPKIFLARTMRSVTWGVIFGPSLTRLYVSGKH